MNYRNIKNTIVVLAMIGASLIPSVKAEATGLSEVVSAGVAVTMEHSDDEVVLASAVAPSVVEGYTVLGVVEAESGYINIREEANTESKIVGKIAKNAICEVVSTEDEWFEIESGEIKGYISSEYLLTGIAANRRKTLLISRMQNLDARTRKQKPSDRILRPRWKSRQRRQKSMRIFVRKHSDRSRK